MSAPVERDAPLSPTLKRKRGDSAGSNAEIVEQIIEEFEHPPSDDDDDDMSEMDLEDLVDSLATSTQPHELMAACTPAEVRSRIREVGSSQFVSDLLKQTGKTPEEAGRIFGLEQDNVADPELFMMLLESVIVHSLQRRRKLKQYNTIDDAAALLKKSKNIMVITGAGISTSLGIPDFRSKHTGFYSKLQEMGFNEPEDVFDIHIFDEQPEIFYSLAGDILPKGKEFTPTHGFIRLIQDKDKLQTNYTQNIDNLEANAGLDSSKVIQCHGSFATATCRKCKYQVPGEEIFDDLRAKQVSYCKRCKREMESGESIKPLAKKVKPTFDDDDSEEDDDIPQAGVMKPDITFFGEQLPDNFFQRFSDKDSHEADLVIVIGTSLKVAPVADMPNHLPEHIPHIYISREPCRHIAFDIQLLGNCDTVCWELSKRAGWTLDHEMIRKDMKTTIEPHELGAYLWSVTEESSPPSEK